MSTSSPPRGSVAALEYYRGHGPITDPGEYASLLTGLPTEIASLRDVAQGVMIHIFHAHRLGVTLPDERTKEVQIRKVADKLARIKELDDRPVAVARDPDRRLVGNCRDYSVFLCSLLRHQGVPARARCGFESYFTPGKHSDHWICEYWSSSDGRWMRADAQIDSAQREAFGFDFDLIDLPHGKFLSGGEVWRLCRSGELDPDNCGLSWEEGMEGLWFVRDNLLRDFMALNRFEVMPWDGNEGMGGRDVSPDEYDFLDRLAGLTTGDDDAFGEIRALYESNPSLRMPANWRP